MAQLWNRYIGTDGAQVTQANTAAGGTTADTIVINNAVANSGGPTLLYSTAAAIEGSTGARITLSANTTYVRYSEPTPAARGVVRLPVRFSSAPSTAAVVAGIRNEASSWMAQIVVSSSGRITATQGSVAISGSSYTATALDHLYWVELAATAGATTSTGRVEMHVYDSDGTTELWSFDSGTTVNTGTGNVKYFQHGGVSTAGGWTTFDLDSFQGGALASGFWGPLSAEAGPPVVTVSQPAGNLVDLRSSTSGDSSSLTYPSPTHVSGPILTVSSLDDGLWLFAQDSTTSSVYTVSVVQGDTQSDSENVTVPHLPTEIIHANAPLVPGGAHPGSTWV